MCGIVGYVGCEQAAPLLLEGLAKLEYRGYDSAGIAVRNHEKAAEVVKAKGRLAFLNEKTDNGNAVIGNCGIGHTRWATHGEPSENNAHPHSSENGDVIAVHNGIIENYQELKEKLMKKGYVFYSQTDTEVVVKLIDYYYKKYKIGPIDALAKTMVRVRGSYALAVMFKELPDEVYVARKDSPMIIGQAEEGVYVASDVPAILNHTRNVYYIGNLQMGRLTQDSIDFYDLNGDIVEKEMKTIEWDAEAAEKGGYEHFMMKEIHEQPKAVADTIHAAIADGQIDPEVFGLTDEDIKSISQIHIIGCGSAYHAGMVGQYIIEELARIPVRVDLASEFRYRKPILNKNDLVIVISQSGETADTLAALREAKSQGVRTLGFINVVGSSIAREADSVFYTLAGPEIAVATTKGYTTQVAACDLIAIYFAYVKGTITEARYKQLLADLEKLPQQIEIVLREKGRIQWFSSKFANAKDMFFIGRGMDYAICLEGSLKMKEISYINSSAYAAGELKHGTISLIEDQTPVIGVLTQSSLYEKTISNMVEVGSRGAYLVGLTSAGHYSTEDTADFTIYIPKTDPLLSAILAVIPLQLMGYYVSVSKGNDVDKPRNLAKSVTVE